MLFIIKIYKRNNPEDVEDAINELNQFYYKKEVIYCGEAIGWTLKTFSWDNWKFMKKLFNEAKIKYIEEEAYC